MLTLRDLIDGLGVRVVAGEESLDVGVRWAHISELPDPTPWLSGGELLLSTGMNLGADPVAYLDRLTDHGLAALGIGIGMEGGGVAEIPPELIAAARERSFPLIEVPYEVPFLAIAEKAASYIVNEQYAVLRSALSAHERLEHVVLSEQGLPGVVTELAASIGGGAAVLDARGELLAAHGIEHAEDPDTLKLPIAPPGMGAAPPQAWLVARREGEPLRELDRLVVHQAVTVVALELLRSRVASDTERRLAGDVLTSALSGDLTGVELRRRLKPFGLGERGAALVVDVPDATEALQAALRAEGVGGIATEAGSLACALLAAPAGEEELFELGERILTRMSEQAARPVSGGAGRATAPADLRRSFHEARCALQAHSNGAGLSTHHELGSAQLLLSLQDDEALALFVDSILAPIEQAEGGYGGELMRSLEVFIEANGHWERAAARLDCHRHTLRYRVRRIEELTGRSLDSARDRIDFWLALRGRELLN